MTGWIRICVPSFRKSQRRDALPGNAALDLERHLERRPAGIELLHDLFQCGGIGKIKFTGTGCECCLFHAVGKVCHGAVSFQKSSVWLTCGVLPDLSVTVLRLILVFKAAPHNSARSLRQDFCPNSKFGKRRNTVCTRKGYAASVSQLALATAALYFPFSIPKSGRKRSAHGRRRFVQRFPNIIPAESASVKTFIFVQISPGRACEIRRKKVYYKKYVSPEKEGQDDDRPHPRMLRRP